MSNQDVREHLRCQIPMRPPPNGASPGRGLDR